VVKKAIEGLILCTRIRVGILLKKEREEEKIVKITLLL
jgi:hypothetical protein